LQIELSIILVNWNGGRFLAQAVESIVAFPPSIEYEIVVVDNASTDESMVMLRSSDPAKQLIERDRLRIIENKENRGFGCANNQGFAATAAPLVLLLNPDAEITAGSIDRLVQTVRSDSSVGAAGPKILNPDGSLQISVWRNPPAAWDIVLGSLKLYLMLPRKFRGEVLLGGHWDHNRQRSVPMLGGAAILVRREVINTVGGFDERYHMYGEDHDWCLRITRAGWLLIFQPEATVIHRGGWSSLQRWSDLEKIRVQLEAHYVFQKQALSRPRLMTNILAYYLTESAQHVWRRLRNVDAPDVKLIMDVYKEQLKTTLRNNHSR
jgi:N-acetylglucosaminyl-diphospho-decaprenol L-rhamnosyltransferase